MKLIEWITGNRQKKVTCQHFPLYENEGKIRSSEEELASRLTLYGHTTCIFCRDVNNVIDQLDINIKVKNTFKYPEYKQDLLIGGGDTSVPCLRITFQFGNDHWLYDSTAIIDFLIKSFPRKTIENKPLDS